MSSHIIGIQPVNNPLNHSTVWIWIQIVTKYKTTIYKLNYHGGDTNIKTKHLMTLLHCILFYRRPNKRIKIYFP